MPWTLCTSGAAVRKAGANASSINQSGVALRQWSDDAEGRIVTQTRLDWRSDFSSMPTDIQNALADLSSSMIAKQIIAYDMTGYTRAEAQTLLDIHDDIIRSEIEFFKDFKTKSIKSAN